MSPPPEELPAGPCALSPEAHRRLEAIEGTLGKIHVALVGNPDMGHKGLVARVEATENKVEAHDRKLLVWGAIATAFLTAFEFLKDKILRS